MPSLRAAARSDGERVAQSSLAPIRRLGPADAGRKRDRVVAMIIDAIRAGAYSEGDRLPSERTLAAEIGVSRAIVSAAIDELERSNVVEVRRGRYGGTFVVSASNIPPGLRRLEAPDADAIRWLLEAREPVELAALNIASQRARLADLRELQRLCKMLPDLVERPRAFAETGFTLLNRIAETTQNPFIIQIVRELVNEQATLRFGLPEEPRPERLRVVATTFGLMIDGLVSGDPEQMRRAVSAHVAGVRATYLGDRD